MIYTLIAIKDRAIEAFQPVQAVRAESEGIRAFTDMLQNPDSRIMYKHPDDFDLYQVGSFDDHTGILTPSEPRKIADGKALSIQQGA